MEGWGRYTLRPKAQNVGQQYNVLFRGRDVENREERREPLYWRVFTLPQTGEVTVEGKPMCACLSSFEGAV